MKIEVKDNEKILSQVEDSDFKEDAFIFSEEVDTIEMFVFTERSDLKKLTLPETLTTIRNGAFANCTNLEAINLDNVTTIDTFAFENCNNLKSLSLTSIEYLAPDVFTDCKNLQVLSLNSPRLKKIENMLLNQCSSLKTLILSGSIVQIEQSAFNGCNGLEYILIDTENNEDFERIKNLLPSVLKHRVYPMALLADIQSYQVLSLEQFELACNVFEFAELPLHLTVKHINPYFRPFPQEMLLQQAFNAVPLPTNKKDLARYKQELEHVTQRYITIYKLSCYLKSIEKGPSIFVDSDTTKLLKKLIHSLHKGELSELTAEEKKLIRESKMLLQLITPEVMQELGLNEDTSPPLMSDVSFK